MHYLKDEKRLCNEFSVCNIIHFLNELHNSNSCCGIECTKKSALAGALLEKEHHQRYQLVNASAPETISLSSVVIAACLARL